MNDLKFGCLLDNTREVLQQLIKNNYIKNFILVGGSALTLHLCHRKSEDLDFFTFEGDSFNINKINSLTNGFKKEIVNISDEQIDIFLDGVKVTFFNAKWSFLKPNQKEKFYIASLEQIAIMKVHTLFLRAKYRDYYDLYFLAKRFGLLKLYELSKDVLDGINFKLFSSALIYIDDITDEDIKYLSPIKKISLKEIRNYFEQELKQIARKDNG